MVELCSIPDCEREIIDEFCSQHIQARTNLEDGFERWQNAYGKSFTKEKYYSELLENNDVKTGQWVVDIILYELDDETP